MSKPSFKKRLFLLAAGAPLAFRRWSIQKKLFISLLTLITILGINALLTSFELYRLKDLKLNLSYLIYINVLGILTGALFIWVLLKSVIRPMKKMVEEIETKSFIDPAKAYGLDEIGDLARAVSYMKRTHSVTGEVLEEKTRLIEAILNHAVDSIFIFNTKGEIVSTSRSFLETFGYSQEEVELVDLNLIIPSIHLQEVIQNFEGQQAQKNFYVRELEAKKSNHKTFWVECSICPIEGKSEKIYVAVIRHLHKKNKINALFKRI